MSVKNDAPNFAKPPLTKIIATVGPASTDRDVVCKLIEAGVAVFRLNFGHGTLQEHAARVRTIRDCAAALGKPVAIMGDVQGPKIRIGAVEEGGVAVHVGDTIIIQRDALVATALQRPVRLSTTYSALIDDVQPGERLLIADGTVRLLTLAKRADELECTVMPGGGGQILSSKGINLPDTHINADLLDESDWADVEWSVANDLDFLALSFVRSRDDVTQLRKGLSRIRSMLRREQGNELSDSISPIRIVAKIELPEAVHNIESILDAADSIMIARGDLGVEMDLARVPVIQRQLLEAAEAHGKPCIVATQMLESMIHAPNPTRAEANDVAGAILDGTDAVMLSGETAIGAYPVVAVESMRRIALYTEQYIAAQPATASPPRKLIESRYRTAALAHGAWHIAHDIAAKFIVVWSQHGGGARYLSQNDFNIPIIACTSDHRSARQMQLLRGVTPVRMPVPENLGHFTRIVDAYLLETGWAEAGDTCILMAGAPIGKQGVTNSLAIHVIGDVAGGYM